MSPSHWIAGHLWLIPLLPLAASFFIGSASKKGGPIAAATAISAAALSFLFSLWAFILTIEDGRPATDNFTWFEVGGFDLKLGWILDPLSAVMVLMVSFLATVIFVFSAAYMADDARVARFFSFLSFFAAAMLGLVLANSLLLLFICWELVGLASYLLIGFWFQRPAAAAAAKKAFIVTRLGDMGFFLGLIWLYSQTGTSLFYDSGAGCLENEALSLLAHTAVGWGPAASTVIGLLIFCGAIGKSGQVPLHVWLPDAMEGPTPVSALIHAATMVAAGVFLVARMYPLMDADSGNIPGVSTALAVIAFVGALTAVFAAIIAVAQSDIKRILAYSTVSQLGYMMIGLGTGGVAVGMFHLFTHGFFKALLFLGAGSVIHACGHEQDIRRMGGLRKFMPVTFATYAVGSLALMGAPLFFSGFWSKDEILRSAFGWPLSFVPFCCALAGVFLTAFYMTRQVLLVFYGPSRTQEKLSSVEQHHAAETRPAESPALMTIPLVVLAIASMALALFGTPAWPWFQRYLEGQPAHLDLSELASAGFLLIAFISTVFLGAGAGAAWRLYHRPETGAAAEIDPLEQIQPRFFRAARDRFFVDELYQGTIVRFQSLVSDRTAAVDERVLGGAVTGLGRAALLLGWLSRFFDELAVNQAFDSICAVCRRAGRALASVHDGQIQNYLRALALVLAGLVLLLMLG